MVTIDTKLSHASGKMPLSAWWFLPSFLVCLAPLFYPGQETAASPGVIQPLLFALAFGLNLLFLILYYVTARRRCGVQPGQQDQSGLQPDCQATLVSVLDRHRCAEQLESYISAVGMAGRPKGGFHCPLDLPLLSVSACTPALLEPALHGKADF